MRSIAAGTLLVCVVCADAPTWAQGRSATADRSAARQYAGVVPSGDAFPPWLAARAAHYPPGRAVVAWSGFQMIPQGSRIFLLVTASTHVQVQRSPGRILYRFANATVPDRNNRRPLETQAFETPVRRAQLSQRGRDVELVIELRAEAEPQVSQQPGSNGLEFVFLDFPHWTAPASAAPDGASHGPDH
jgi:hypothetical protein